MNNLATKTLAPPLTSLATILEVPSYGTQPMPESHERGQTAVAEGNPMGQRDEK